MLSGGGEVAAQCELLRRLNECVGVSARRAFQQQTQRLLQRSQTDTQRDLPELCKFVSSLVPESVRDGDTPRSTALVRRVFRDPQAQWLSRSARQSGVTALLCQQLMRLAEDSDGTSDGTTELVMHVLWDALLTPCTQRLGAGSTATRPCEWRPAQIKPRFHAMSCFGVWTTLLPFAAQLAHKHPSAFECVLLRYGSDGNGPCRQRTNCVFAHVGGMWQLLETLNSSSAKDEEAQEAMTELMSTVLRFMVYEKLLRPSVARSYCAGGNAESKAKSTEMDAAAALFDDLLLDKFFTALQEFSFSCWRAGTVVRPALMSALLDSFGTPTTAVPPRVALFAAVAAIFTKGLASELVVALVERNNAVGTEAATEEPEPLLLFLVGVCAHVDLVPLPPVFHLLNTLLDRYNHLQDTTSGPRQQRRRQLVFWIVYVTLHRRQAVDSLRCNTSSDSSVLMDQLRQFQMRMCSEIAQEDFYAAAPVHWVAVVWKHWVFLSDEDVAVFTSEADDTCNAEEDVGDRANVWRGWRRPLTFRSVSSQPFPRMIALLRPHWISPLPLSESRDDEDQEGVQARKRRRATALASAKDKRPRSNSEQDERRFDVLLLPDVMERVCSFMSAKRLCRMSLVCRAFAEVSRRDVLWRPLYLQLGFTGAKKRGTESTSRIQCRHGENYEHNWPAMFRERWKGLKKLRRKQRRLATTRQYQQDEEDQQTWPLDDTRATSGTGTIDVFIPQLCCYCGCHRMLNSQSDVETHNGMHEKLTCPKASCRASFTAVAKYKHHLKQAHPERSESRGKQAAASTKPRLACGYDGCDKSYVSAKRLETHRQEKSHILGNDTGADAGADAE